MPNRITKYYYDSDPSLLPTCGESFWDEAAIRAAGEDPEDEEIICTTLAQAWRGHLAGATIVTGLTVEGHLFTVIEEASDAE